MSLRYAFALAALAVTTACADGTGGPDQLFGPNAVVGNPPPPPFAGRVQGSFQASQPDGKIAHTLPGLSLEREGGSGTRGNPPTGTFLFEISPVTYSANPSNTEFFMNFPRQPLPRELKGKIPALKPGQIVVWDGRTFGAGVIAAFDEKNGGFWLIDMSQFTQPYEVFKPGCRSEEFENCVLLDASIVAVFYRILGVDRKGKLRYEAFPSEPSFLTFLAGQD